MALSKLEEQCGRLGKIDGSTVVAVILPQQPLQKLHVLRIHELISHKDCTK